MNPNISSYDCPLVSSNEIQKELASLYWLRVSASRQNLIRQHFRFACTSNSTPLERGALWRGGGGGTVKSDAVCQVVRLVDVIFD